MLPTSVRRVVASGPQVGLASCLVSSAPKAVASSAPVFVGRHQRRCSSSKPSRSDNGSKDVAEGQSVTASPATRRDGKAGENRKRKSKDASRKSTFSNLPMVPNTHHMSQEALGLSSFFSLHRPISVTETMPRTVTDEHFANIFNPRTKASKITDTTSTISSTIEHLEGPMAQMTIGGHDDGMGEIKTLDGTESSISLQVDAMSGEFLPFRPPPLPQPLSAAEAERAPAATEDGTETDHHRVYQAMFTIEESTTPSGEVRIIAHSPRVINEPQPKGFLERMAFRQMRFDDSRRGQDMYAISVKRQRKLKMKKKKYKKLMKRTRNLRRKLDRT
ncbi:hypothetical protein B0I35DRAFT_459916 [Stachybotrys elegans]|uniref:Small ribosomal subunit protein mS38 n=1 Tax=Stachybotrys elegans TaxID=80388 RepID=A0A8K0SUR3_9HYPO|nr:hypothetical protein B0I35DRAFT_459916 [Stachybotrys elegans]